MNTQLCIHGHFYQPPRENPWLGLIPAESSAAPMANWNERILRESYAPLAWARRMDSNGKIFDIINCYEWISFNVGPTLMQWLRNNSPETVARMRDGDAKSLARTGHGNAIAQVYHHVIMPLATPEDRELEIRWAIDDFKQIFERMPEGLWLSEAAVDTASLESLAGAGISFVILAPRQAKAVIREGKETPVNEGSLNFGEPYMVKLPSGKTITAVFYNGALSQAIAFESLLRDGEQFWRRIAGTANSMPGEAPLLTLCTDGETYGHHFKFGEMALAHVLAQGASHRDGISITNIAAYIADHPARTEVLLHEPSSWSCVHGVERWRSNCGCTDGGHAGWNQKWRGPLRDALEIMRDSVSGYYLSEGEKYFQNTRQALLEYGTVLAEPENKDDFTARFFKPEVAGRESPGYDNAWKLLAAQEESLAAFASCAWFFDDISRIEPENGLTYALRAIDLTIEAGGPDPRPAMLEVLSKAVSNRPEKGTGKDLLLTEVEARHISLADICLMSILLIKIKGGIFRERLWTRFEWPYATVRVSPTEINRNTVKGNAVIRNGLEVKGKSCEWELEIPGTTIFDSFTFKELAGSKLTLTTGGVTEVSTPGGLSRPMMEYLLMEIMSLKEGADRPAQLAGARHFISMTKPWPEEQPDLIQPEFSYSLLPYVLVECVMNGAIPEEILAQVKIIMEKHLDKLGKTLAGKVLQQEIQSSLHEALEQAAEGNDSGMDRQFAALVERVGDFLPETDLWAVQNRIWEAGHKTFPLLAKALGFGEP